MVRYWISLLLGVGAIGFGMPTYAQSNIVADPTVGTKVTPNFQGFPIEAIQGGAERGQNLFHSFQEFNISPDRAALFLVPNNTIQNVFARVTGQNSSQIDGTLATRFDDTFAASTANLFLMNPNGIIFGAGARLDVGGSFVATTANAIGFGDRAIYSATNPSVPSELLTINPSVFLFDAIAAQNQGIVVRSQITGLQVPDGKSLLLLGGSVSLDGGQLNAFGGRVELGGVAQVGNIGIVINANDLQLSFPVEVTLADVSLTNASSVTTLGDVGRGIAINAQNIYIRNRSSLNTGIAPNLGESGVKAGDINLNATGIVTLDTSLIFGAIAGVGNGSNVNITGKNVNVINAVLGSSSLGRGNGGNVTIQAKDTIFFKGGGVLTSIVSAPPTELSEFPGVGNSGNINLEARSILLSNGAIIGTFSLGLGKSGNIQAIARDSLSAQNGSILSTNTSGQGNAGSILIQGENQVSFEGVNGDVRGGLSSTVQRPANILTFTNSRRGGNIQVETGKLSIANGAAIDSSTVDRGDGGDIFVKVRETISLDNYALISSSVSPTGIGNAGNVIIEAKQLAVRNGSQILSATFGNGNAGDLTIQRSELVEIDGGSVTDTGLFTQVGGQVGSPSVGSVGNLMLETNQLILRNGGQVNATIFGRGTGSDSLLTIRAADIQLIGTTAIPGRTGIQPSAIQTRIEPFGSGNASNLIIETDRLSIENGARIAADIEQGGRGKAGNIFIQAGESVKISGSLKNNSTQSSLVSLLTTSINQGAEGSAGDLSIEAKQLFLQDGAQINARSQGQGKAGNIFMNIKELLQANDGTISTTANRSSGGKIDIIARDIRLNGDSNITTFVSSGAGGGGDITLTANSIVALNDSDILAFARDGRGGNVTLNTRAFFGQTYRPAPFGTDPATLDGNGRVDINASGSLSSGTIVTPDTSFIQNSLNQLPKDAIDTTKLLANTCIVRKDKPEGTFYITGTGGLPNRPSDRSPSQYPTNTIVPTATRPWQKGDPIVEPPGFYTLANGRLVMSRECPS